MNKIEVIEGFLAWVGQNTDAVLMEYEDYEYHYSDEGALVKSYQNYLTDGDSSLEESEEVTTTRNFEYQRHFEAGYGK